MSDTPVYQQSAVIPYRIVDKQIEVMLVTSRKGTRWVVPKGLLEPEMTPAESAANEAWEEAGVRGEVNDEPVGHFTYDKWGGTCEVDVYLMHVTEERDAWLEDFRTRQWFSLDDAAAKVREKELREMISSLAQSISD